MKKVLVEKSCPHQSGGTFCVKATGPRAQWLYPVVGQGPYPGRWRCCHSSFKRWAGPRRAGGFGTEATVAGRARPGEGMTGLACRLGAGASRHAQPFIAM
jgi:hypothetical protein